MKGIQDRLGFWIPLFVSRTWDSGFQNPGFRISEAKISRIPDSGFPYMGRHKGTGLQLLVVTER